MKSPVSWKKKIYIYIAPIVINFFNHNVGQKLTICQKIFKKVYFMTTHLKKNVFYYLVVKKWEIKLLISVQNALFFQVRNTCFYREYTT